MTLSELLEELKEVDPKLYDDISHLELIGWQQPRNLAMDHLQGCLQRACEMREWDLRQDQWAVNLDSTDEVYCYSAIVTGISETGRSPEYEGRGKSQAEALLAAYVAAVKGESGLWLDRMRSARMS